jgi:UDP-N-acetylmuramate--alanine ligase
LRAAIASVKRLYPDKKLTVIFQPHLFTRTRDFADGFAEVLDMADELTDAGYLPGPRAADRGCNSEMILNRMKLAK